MKDGPNIVGIAALIADHARVEVLTTLMSGQALTATELADIAGVTKQTMSSHLAKLVEARLISCSSQGRHRYFRIASEDVAHLLETLMVRCRSESARFVMHARTIVTRVLSPCLQTLHAKRTEAFPEANGVTSQFFPIADVAKVEIWPRGQARRGRLRQDNSRGAPQTTIHRHGKPAPLHNAAV
jgi:DNA-binding transcriptional ArsR family regulator